MTSVSSVTSAGRVGSIRVRGRSMTASVGDAFTTGSIDMSTSGPDTISMTFADPDLALLRSGVFARGAHVDYADLELVVRGVSVSPGSSGPVLQVTCRDEGWVRLATQIGARVWRDTSVADVAINRAKSAGLDWLVEPSASKNHVTQGKKRTKTTPLNVSRNADESTCSMLARYAGDMYRLFYVSAGRLVFATPGWLAKHTTVHHVGYNVRTGVVSGFGAPTGLPSLNRSEDSKRGIADLTCDFAGDDADRWRSGHVLRLTGVPTFGGDYLASAVTIPLSLDATVSVTAAIPASLKDTTSGDVAPATDPPTDTSTPTGSSLSAVLGARSPVFAQVAAAFADPNPPSGGTGGRLPFDGTEMVAFAAARAGLRTLPAGADVQQLTMWCSYRATRITPAKALTIRGALVFTRGIVGVVVAKNTVVVPKGRAYVRGTTKAGDWTAAAYLPDLTYPRTAR